MIADLSLVVLSEAGMPFDTWRCKHRPRGEQLAWYAWEAFYQRSRASRSMNLFFNNINIVVVTFDSLLSPWPTTKFQSIMYFEI